MEFHSSFYYSANPKSSPAHPSLKQPSFGPTKQNCPKSSASHHHPSFAYQLRPIILTPLQSSHADHQCALHFQIMWPHTSSTLRLTLWDTLALSHLPFSSSLSSLPTSPSHWLIYLTQIVPLIRQLPICHLLVYITTFNLKQQLSGAWWFPLNPVLSQGFLISQFYHQEPDFEDGRGWGWGALVILFYFQSICPV